MPNIANEDDEDYRYGFNGMEKDGEFTNSSSHYDFGARIYDGRIGRWLAVDEKDGKYPTLTPYAFSNNNSLLFKDFDGEDFGITITPAGVDAAGNPTPPTMVISAVIYVGNSFSDTDANGRVGSNSSGTNDNSLFNDVQASANQLQNNLNAANLTYTDNSGTVYNISFQITTVQDPKPQERAANDPQGNFVRSQQANGAAPTVRTESVIPPRNQPRVGQRTFYYSNGGRNGLSLTNFFGSQNMGAANSNLDAFIGEFFTASPSGTGGAPSGRADIVGVAQPGNEIINPYNGGGGVNNLWLSNVLQTAGFNITNVAGAVPPALPPPPGNAGRPLEMTAGDARTPNSNVTNNDPANNTQTGTIP